MKRYLLLIAGLLAASTACNEGALDKINPNELSVPTYFKTGKDIVSAVNAVYSSLQAQHLYGREYFFLHDTRSDEMQSGGGQLETHRAQLLNGVHRADNQVPTQVWQGWYRVIHQANVVIENAPKATENVTEALKNRVIGEAKFLRGWAYFELVSLWGGVPLSTSVVTSPGQSKARASEDEVYAQVVSDLSEAIVYLPPKSEYSDEEIGRASRGAAQAMLARVYLQRGQYAEARPLLEGVIQSGQYRLADVPYAENFREEDEFNAESVWEVSFSEAFGDFNWNNAGEGTANEITFRAQEYGPTAWRNLIPSDRLLAEFETVARGDAKDDPRYGYSFYAVGDAYNNGQNVLKAEQVQGAEPKVSWKKYQKLYKAPAENFAKSGINFRVIRYAEVLLMMAEVENETGNSAKALDYLNAVRGRADVQMPPYPTARFPCRNGEEVFAALAHEKLVELGGEQVRNRDLLRWRKLGKLKGEPLSYFQSGRHELLPIPAQEISNNDKIDQADQNAGY